MVVEVRAGSMAEPRVEGTAASVAVAAVVVTLAEVAPVEVAPEVKLAEVAAVASVGSRRRTG